MKRSSEFATEVAQALKNQAATHAQDVAHRDAAQKAIQAKEQAEYEALIARNEAALRATGVVDLFEELRDSQELIWRRYQKIKTKSSLFGKRYVTAEEVELAHIEYSPTRDGVSFSWDAQSYDAPCLGDNYDTRRTACRSIRAELSPKNKLLINGEPVKGDLQKTIITAVLNSKRE